MKYSELVSTIAERKEMPKVAVDNVIRCLQDVIIGAVASGDKVSIPGFASFSAQERPARNYRSPQDGSVVRTEDMRIPKVKPLKEFKETVKDAK